MRAEIWAAVVAMGIIGLVPGLIGGKNAAFNKVPYSAAETMRFRRPNCPSPIFD